MSAHAYYNGLAIPPRRPRLALKVAMGVSRFERQVAALETAIERIEHALDAVSIEDAGALSELRALKRGAAAVASEADAMAEQVASTRDTLVGFDEIGMPDARLDDRALDELADRADAVATRARAALETIGVLF